MIMQQLGICALRELLGIEQPAQQLINRGDRRAWRKELRIGFSIELQLAWGRSFRRSPGPALQFALNGCRLGSGQSFASGLEK